MRDTSSPASPWAAEQRRAGTVASGMDSVRLVVLKRPPDPSGGGFGFSIKGGRDTSAPEDIMFSNVKVEVEELVQRCEENIKLSEVWLKAVKAENSSPAYLQPEEAASSRQDDEFILRIEKVKVEQKIEDEQKAHSSTDNEDHITSKILQKPLINKQDMLQHMQIRMEEHLIECDPCEKSFGHKQTMQIHKRSHPVESQDGKSLYRCQICKRRFSESLLRSHMLTHKEIQHHSCDQCGKYFSTKARLLVHMLMHTGKKSSTTCDLCHKSFSSKSSLYNHILIHTGEKPHACDQCDKCFRAKVELRNHKLMHTGEKPHACDLCNKCFGSKVQLYYHRRLHTTEKPHACDQCNKHFYKKSELDNHKLIHTGEKPHICDLCNKSFRVKTNLTIHRRIHTGEKPHACDLCHKNFRTRMMLSDHKRLHNKEKLYKCDHCGKGVNRKSDLRVHMLIHTGEKPHECDQCGKNFRRKGDMKIHKRMHLREPSCM